MIFNKTGYDFKRTTEQVKTIDSGVAAGAEPSMLLLDISTGDCKQPLKLEEGEFLSRPETVHQPAHSPHLKTLLVQRKSAHHSHSLAWGQTRLVALR